MAGEAAGQDVLPATEAAPQAQAQQVVVEERSTSIGSTDAASQGSVDGGILRDVPLLRPGEALETVPGLVVTQHSGDGKANQYFLRGYNLDHGTDFATFLDGVPLNMPTNAHGQGYADANCLIPELVDHIDYAKGPYFADAGDFSSAGTASIRYRDRLDENLAGLTIGAYGYRRALLAGSVPQPEGPTVLGALELQHQNGPWSVPEGLHKTNGLLRLSDETPEQGWSLDAAIYDARWTSTDQVPLELIQTGQLGRFSSLDPTDGGDTGRAAISAEWHRGGDTGATKLSAYAEHYRLQLFSNFTFFELRPSTGDQFEQAEHRDLFGLQAVQTVIHGLFALDSLTDVGAQIRHDNVAVSLTNTEARAPVETVSDDRVGETEAGVYVQNSTSWTAWLRTLTGVREQYASANMTALAIPQNSGSASAWMTLPKLSIILGPWARTEFFFNAGRGFHSNDARGVIDRVDSTTGLPSSRVPLLVPSTGKEIGIRTAAIDSLQSSLALWSLNSASELVYNADSGIGSTSANGASRRYGVEWNNRWQPGRYVLLDSDLAWTQAHYASNNDNGQRGDLIPNAVSKVGMLRLTSQRWDPWSAGLEARFIGSYPLSQDGSLHAPSALVTNLRIQRDLGDGLTMSLDVLNLLDRSYYDVAYQQDYRVNLRSPVVTNGVTVHPGEPRQLRLTLQLRF